MSILIRTVNRSILRFPSPNVCYIRPKKPLGLSTGKIPFRSKYALEQAEAAEHAGRTYKYWKYISIFVCAPVLSYLIYKEGKEFLHEEMEQREYIPYSHMRIRNKQFPWGNKSLFHNQLVNPG